MGKLLRLRDFVLLTAATTHDILDLIPSRSEYISKFKYKRKSYLSTVSKLLTTGEIIRKINKKGEIKLILTTKGKNEFKRRFSLEKMQTKKWRGEFMIVIFDIPEKNNKIRRRLRTKLKELGFGMLQKSVWISPYHFEEDMREFLVTQNLTNYVYVLSAKKLLAGNTLNLVKNIWNLDKINNDYTVVLKLAKDNLKQAVKKYFDTLLKDPMLPKELLPKNWVRKKAKKEIEKIIANSRSIKSVRSLKNN